MLNISQSSKCCLGIGVVLVAGLVAGVMFVHNVQEQRSLELQTDISELQIDLEKLENEEPQDDSKKPEGNTKTSQGKLEKDKLLGLKKDIATLKKESFASQDAPWLLLFQTLGTIGVVGGLWITWNGQSIERESNKKTFEDAEKRLISDQFFNAVELLGSEGCSRQLVGIYTLESIAEAWENYEIRVIKILCGYIKDESPYPAQNTSGSKEVKDEPTGLNIKIALEVIRKIKNKPEAKDEPTGLNIKIAQAIRKILEVIRKIRNETPKEEVICKIKNKPQKEKLTKFGIFDFNRTYWSHLDFELNEESWEYLEMENSFLQQVFFQGADLTKARFAESTLTDVEFGASTLNEASFRGTHLEAVKFNSAKLRSTNFTDATLKAVNFDNADLENAGFENATLEGIDFKRVKSMKGVNFSNAKLQGVVFKKSHCQEADFSGVDLTNVIFESNDHENASEADAADMLFVADDCEDDNSQSEGCSKSGDLWQKMRALLTRARTVGTSGTHLP